MIKFLKKFFNLGKPSIYDEIENPKEPNEVNTTWQYKKLRKLSLVYNSDPEAITDFVYLNLNNHENFVNKCMHQSIVDGDLNLFKELFLRQRRRSIGIFLSVDPILNYAYTALKHDKVNIIEYTLDYFNSQYSSCVSYSSDFKVRRIMHYLIDNDKTDYFDLFKRYKLTNFNSYITETLDDISKYPYKKFDTEINRLTFVLANFSDEINKKDLSRYLNSIRANGNKKSLIPEEIIELFDNLDFVKKKHESKQLFEELSGELTPSTPIAKQKKLKV